MTITDLLEKACGKICENCKVKLLLSERSDLLDEACQYCDVVITVKDCFYKMRQYGYDEGVLDVTDSMKKMLEKDFGIQVEIAKGEG